VLEGWLRPADPAPSVDAETLPLEVRDHLFQLENELRRAQDDLAALAAAPLPSRYRISLADVIPVSDPSSTRSAVWVLLRDPAAVSVDCAVLWRNRLLGRVVGVFPAPPVAKIQLLSDAGFRVRFEYVTETAGSDVEAAPAGILRGTGVLRGTGRRDADGWPLLSIHHVAEPGDLIPGGAVFTAGEDGIYPPGLLIGTLARAETADRQALAGLLVRADGFPGRFGTVELAVDTISKSLAGYLRPLRDGASGLTPRANGQSGRGGRRE